MIIGHQENQINYDMNIVQKYIYINIKNIVVNGIIFDVGDVEDLYVMHKLNYKDWIWDLEII